MSESKHPLPETLSKALMRGLRSELKVYQGHGFFDVPDTEEDDDLIWNFDSNDDYIQICVANVPIGQTILSDGGLWSVSSVYLDLRYPINDMTSEAAKILLTATKAVEKLNREVAGLAAICQTPKESFDRGAYQIKLASLVAASVAKVTKRDPLILKSPKGITKSGDVYYLGHCYDIKVVDIANNMVEISLRH